MRKIKFIYTLTILSALLVAGPGCKKFLDINKNPNSPTPSSVQLSMVLSSTERSIGGAFSLGSGVASVTSVWMHQTIGRVAADRYGGSADGTWSTLYSALGNLNVIIKRAPEESRFVYGGIAKILKAYTFSMMVDIWGDLPYSEFDKFEEGITQPKYDKGADIYPQLITLLDEGIADLNNTAVNTSTPSSDDYIYGGNRARWIKAANTIKLKLYTQIRRVQNVTTQVTALLSNPANLINAQNESFMLPFGPQATTDDRHPAFGDYNATQRGGQLFSLWLYEIMKGRNPDIFNGLTDPRIPYYIYNQKKPTDLPENCTEYREGGFVTIAFGSNGRCRDGSNSNTYSMLGLYPAGGRFDEGAGIPINASANGIAPQRAGTGALPHQFLTYADRLYLEAELINTGVITGDARAVFSRALNESFNQMDFIITNYIKPGSAGAAQNVPAIATLPATTTYKDGVLAQYDAATTAKKLEIIMTQKWINRIENPVDSYTDYRRTGYPVLFAPAPEGTVTSITSPHDGLVSAVANDRKFPLSVLFSVGDLNINSSAPPQKVVESYKVFWMP